MSLLHKKILRAGKIAEKKVLEVFVSDRPLALTSQISKTLILQSNIFLDKEEGVFGKIFPQKPFLRDFGCFQGIFP